MKDNKHLILAVDDDTDLLATLGDFLRFEGYEVEAVPSAEDGIARLAEIVPDLIILDISMPGMGGIGFLNEKAQMERVAKVPVMVFTALSNMEKFFKDVEVAGFVAKPCDPSALLKEIGRILDASRSRGMDRSDKPAFGGKKKLLIAEGEAKRMKTKAEQQAYQSEREGETALRTAEQDAAAVLAEGQRKAEGIEKLLDAYEKGGEGLVREAAAKLYQQVTVKARPYSSSEKVEQIRFAPAMQSAKAPDEGAAPKKPAAPKR